MKRWEVGVAIGSITMSMAVFPLSLRLPLCRVTLLEEVYHYQKTNVFHTLNWRMKECLWVL